MLHAGKHDIVINRIFCLLIHRRDFSYFLFILCIHIYIFTPFVLLKFFLTVILLQTVCLHFYSDTVKFFVNQFTDFCQLHHFTFISFLSPPFIIYNTLSTSSTTLLCSCVDFRKNSLISRDCQGSCTVSD